MSTPLSICNDTKTEAESQYGEIWQQIQEIFAGFDQSAFTKELDVVFNNLHDQKLLEILTATRWTGRPGFPIKVIWQTLIVSYALDIPTIQELIRTLRRNPLVAIRCGIHSKEEIPSRFAYYRFIKKLIIHQELIENCMAKTIETLREKYPEIGKVVAIDSTDIPSYAKRNKKPCSDPDAKWGYKNKGDIKKYSWLGYKMHLPVDTSKYEVPLIPIVTPANLHDSPLMIPLVRKNRKAINGLKPEFILGDKGYDAVDNYKTIVKEFKAIPIVDLNLRSKKKLPMSSRNILGIQDHWIDEYGTPYCKANKEMMFCGFQKKYKVLKYCCPLIEEGEGCDIVKRCSKFSYKKVIYVKISNDPRRFVQVPRNSKEWKKIYNKRVAAERAFSILKKDGDGKLINHRIRGLGKIIVNCLLSVLVHQARKAGTILKQDEV